MAKKKPKVVLPKELAAKYEIVGNYSQRCIVPKYGEINFSTIDEAKIERLIKQGFPGLKKIEQKKSAKADKAV